MKRKNNSFVLVIIKFYKNLMKNRKEKEMILKWKMKHHLKQRSCLKKKKNIVHAKENNFHSFIVFENKRKNYNSKRLFISSSAASFIEQKKRCFVRERQLQRIVQHLST